MKKLTYSFFLISVIMILTSFAPKPFQMIINVTNTLAEPRNYENVEVSLNEDFNAKKHLKVTHNNSGKNLICQVVDKNNDGLAETLLFQPEIAAKSSEVYTIEYCDSCSTYESKVYSRFVPERTDDYAWENNRVAFRTYGPKAQKLKEEGDPNGTLSSGLDCWLKKVEYPIINKWYEKHTNGKGSYHEDTGEGFDPYHVGSSRGCGGTGVWTKDTLFVSKNFTTFQTLENGPLRTRFTLDYDIWKASNNYVKEQKMIGLDLNNNLMHIIDSITGVGEITIGLTLHENLGHTQIDTLNFCFSYWEPMKDSELGTGIVVNPAYFLGYTKILSAEPDKSQLLIHLKVIDGKIEYYCGFGWKGSRQFENEQQWNNYLKSFALSLQHPLVVKIVK